MEREINEVVYIAIGVLVLAGVLGFISILVGINGDIATMRNNEVASNQRVQQYREFNKYDGVQLIGNEVIECITEYRGTDIEVLVYNKILGGSNQSTYQKEHDNDEYEESIGGIVGKPFVMDPNNQPFVRYRKSDIIKTGTTGQSGLMTKYDLENVLTPLYPTEHEYIAFIAYNTRTPGERFTQITEDLYTGSMGLDELMTAGKFKEYGDFAVTGIVLIRVK